MILQLIDIKKSAKFNEDEKFASRAYCINNRATHSLAVLFLSNRSIEHLHHHSKCSYIHIEAC